MIRQLLLTLVSLAFLPACSSGPQTDAPEVTLIEESGASLLQVSQVPRFVLSGLEQVAQQDIWLIAGDISSTSQGRIRRGEVPVTVEGSRIPLSSWESGGELILAPGEILEPGQQYSVVALDWGLVGSFTVTEEELPVRYLWGPAVASPGETLVYCQGRPPALRFSGALGERCTSLPVEAVGADFFVPPASFDDHLLEPTPVHVREGFEQEGAPREVDCDGPAARNRAFGAGCAAPGQGGLEVTLVPGVFFMSATPLGGAENSLSLLVEVESEQAVFLGPLEPDTDYHFEISQLLEGGTGKRTGRKETFDWTTGRPEARFVLTEVLADPLGQEPQAEWVEIMNVGTERGSTQGLEVWDSSGGQALPDMVLAPGEMGLIVRSDFSIGPDVVPDPTAVPLVVDSLGDNGLRNTGEVVELRNADGDVLSAVPALSARAGESVARLDPWAPDAAESFRAGPATPGFLVSDEEFAD